VSIGAFLSIWEDRKWIDVKRPCRSKNIGELLLPFGLLIFPFITNCPKLAISTTAVEVEISTVLANGQRQLRNGFFGSHDYLYG